METKENVRQQLEARADELERKINLLSVRAAQTSTEAETRLRSQLSEIKVHLDKVRTRLREKEETDERKEDEALAQIGHAINDWYEEWMSGPK